MTPVVALDTWQVYEVRTASGEHGHFGRMVCWFSQTGNERSRVGTAPKSDLKPLRVGCKTLKWLNGFSIVEF